ncbi:MAG: SLC13 family permease [Sedimenticolaceae bacterium]
MAGSEKRGLWLAAGVALFLLTLLLVPDATMPQAANRVAAVAVLMAVLWIGEAIPIPATALLPVVLFPLLGVMPIESVTANYANHLVFLFLGGFWIAAAVERCSLHRRIALHVLRLMGTRADRIIFGFMAATAFLSMWLSNTATTMMMLPIAMAVASRLGGATHTPFGRVLMLGIAYSASIGGVATLIGTPPNAVLAGVLEKTQGISISFWQWMQFGVPLALLMLLICWWYLTHISARLGDLEGTRGTELFVTELASLGSVTTAEKRVLVIFTTVASLWVFKGVLPFPAISSMSDSTIAIAGALALFVFPAGDRGTGALLDWESAVRVPWDVLILFGGGFALAQGFQQSGLTEWIGLQLDFLRDVHWFLLILAVAVVTIFLTELTSNTATASMLLPIVAGLAAAAGQDALLPMVATALAASFAFMLPVATPPNAIVFASRQVSIAEMARAGIWMNLIGIALIALSVSLLLPWVW